MTEMTINGTDIAQYGARLLDYSVGGTTMTKSFGTATNCALPTVYNAENGTRALNITLTYKPYFDPPLSYSPGVPLLLQTVMAQKAKCDAALMSADPIIIVLPDGYTYRCILTSIGLAALDNTAAMDVAYTFLATQHLPQVTVTIYNGYAQRVTCTSTVPTDCIISVTNNTARDPNIANFNALGFALYVPIGKTIIIDGIAKTITMDGKNAFLQMTDTFIDFPRLQPGANVFDLSDYTGQASAIKAVFKYWPTFF